MRRLDRPSGRADCQAIAMILPPDRLPPLALLRTFEVAARHLSFKRAAAELHVTPAAISQQIKALEVQLGVPLFVRLTRALRLSESGAAMLPPVQQGLACLAAAVQGLRRPGAATVIRLAAPPSLASHWLVPRLPAFYRAHPGIEVRLTSSADTVDRAGEAAALDALSLASGDTACALAILYGVGPYARQRADALLTPDYVPVCAPGLATPDKPLRCPADLLRHVLLHDGTLTGAGLAGAGGPVGHAGEAAWGWPDWWRAQGLDLPGNQPGQRYSNAVLVIAAALAGQGVALAARPLVAAQIAAGSLCVPFDLPIRSPFSYFLLAHPDSADLPAVVAFRQWLLAAIVPQPVLAGTPG
jgi:LysR family glycine cleavage system transcriptional activator